MSYKLPDDWYIEPTGESLILDQKKVAAVIERLLAAINVAAERLEARGHKFGAREARAAAEQQEDRNAKAE